MTCNGEVYTLVSRDVNASKTTTYNLLSQTDGFQLENPVVLQSCLESPNVFGAFCNIPQLPLNDQMQTMCDLTTTQTDNPDSFYQKIIRGDVSSLDQCASIWESALNIQETDDAWVTIENTNLRLPSNDPIGFLGLVLPDVQSMAVSNNAETLLATLKGQLYTTGTSGLLRQVPNVKTVPEDPTIVSGLDTPVQNVTINSNGVIRAALFSDRFYFYGNQAWKADLTPSLGFTDVSYQGMKLWEREDIFVAVFFRGLETDTQVERWAVNIYAFTNSIFNSDDSFLVPIKQINNPNPEFQFLTGFITTQQNDDVLFWSTMPAPVGGRALMTSVHTYEITSDVITLNRWTFDISFSAPLIPDDRYYYTSALIDGNLGSGASPNLVLLFVYNRFAYQAGLNSSNVQFFNFISSDLVPIVCLNESIDHSRKLFAWENQLTVSTTLTSIVIPNQPFTIAPSNTNPYVFALAPNGEDAWIIIDTVLYRLHNTLPPPAWGNAWTNDFPMYFAVGARVSDFGYELLNKNVYVPSTSSWFFGTVERATEAQLLAEGEEIIFPLEVARSSHQTFRFAVTEVKTTTTSGLFAFPYAIGKLQRANEQKLSTQAPTILVDNDSNVTMLLSDESVLWQSNTHDRVSIQTGETYVTNLSSNPFAISSNNGLYILYQSSPTRLRLVFNPFNALRMERWCRNDKDRFNQAIVMQQNLCWQQLYIPNTETFVDSRCTCIGTTRLFELSAPGGLGIPNSLVGTLAETMPCYIPTCDSGRNGDGQSDTNVFRYVQERCSNRVFNICRNAQFLRDVDLKNNDFVQLMNCGSKQRVCQSDNDCNSDNTCFNQQCVLRCSTSLDCQVAYGTQNVTCDQQRCQRTTTPYSSSSVGWWVFVGVVSAICLLIVIVVFTALFAQKNKKAQSSL